MEKALTKKRKITAGIGEDGEGYDEITEKDMDAGKEKKTKVLKASNEKEEVKEKPVKTAPTPLAPEKTFVLDKSKDDLVGCWYFPYSANSVRVWWNGSEFRLPDGSSICAPRTWTSVMPSNLHFDVLFTIDDRCLYDLSKIMTQFTASEKSLRADWSWLSMQIMDCTNLTHLVFEERQERIREWHAKHLLLCNSSDLSSSSSCSSSSSISPAAASPSSPKSPKSPESPQSQRAVRDQDKKEIVEIQPVHYKQCLDQKQLKEILSPDPETGIHLLNRFEFLGSTEYDCVTFIKPASFYNNSNNDKKPPSSNRWMAYKTIVNVGFAGAGTWNVVLKCGRQVTFRRGFSFTFAKDSMALITYMRKKNKKPREWVDVCQQKFIRTLLPSELTEAQKEFLSERGGYRAWG